MDSRERSLDEYQRLLGDCGVALEQAIALPSSFSVLDFRPQSDRGPCGSSPLRAGEAVSVDRLQEDETGTIARRSA